MVELADIFRLHGPDYRAKFGDRMLPSHLRAIHDIERCRPEALGGQLYACDQCRAYHYSYHSCKNRHCPKCQNDQAEAWLQSQQRLLLPLPHFMVTFTLPDDLRGMARSHQQCLYNILFRASPEALQGLALDRRFIGGRVGMVGVLHTWTRDLRYHPHVHYIVAGGGLSADGHWLASGDTFLVHITPLSVIFRAKFRDQLQKTPLFPLVEEHVWKKGWIVHCQPVGSGQHAFKYLAPYILRVAISNNRILQLAASQVLGIHPRGAGQSRPLRRRSARDLPEPLRAGARPTTPSSEHPSSSQVRASAYRGRGTMPGRSTFTATGAAATCARCTCAIEAAATAGPNDA